jgi:hypothetical protein
MATHPYAKSAANATVFPVPITHWLDVYGVLVAVSPFPIKTLLFPVGVPVPAPIKIFDDPVED